MNLQSISGFGPALARRVETCWLVRGKDKPPWHDNPYLLTQVRGIGFILADRVARVMGIKPDAPERINAAALHVLGEAEQSGHTCLPVKDFSSLLQAALGIGGFSRELELDEEKIILDGELIAQRATDFAEHVVAAKFAALRKALPEAWTLPLDLAKIKYQDQVSAFDAAHNKSIFALMGGPGTGKTWLVNELIKGANTRKFALCAPTGKAAKRIEELAGEKAQTIHRLLGVARDGTGPQAHSRGFRFRANARHPLDKDLVIVDEASMCDIRLMADLCDALPPAARLVLIGDPFQLPSVGPGAILRDLRAAGVPHYELTELKRQSPELLIARNCQTIRFEQKVVIDNRRAADFFFVECQNAVAAQAQIVELVTKRLPQKYMFDPKREIVTITALRDRGELSRKELNLALRARLNPEGAASNPKPTIGDRVIQLSNNYELEIMNGDVGTVVELNDGSTSSPVWVNQAGQAREVKFGELAIELDVPAGRIVVAPWEDFDIDFAYALTVHKFQGSEAPAIVLAIHEQQGAMVPTANWLYTAISRAREVCVVVGSRRALEMAATRHREVKRHTRLATFLQNGTPD